MREHVREEAAHAVEELRLFVLLCTNEDVRAGTREARKLEAARRAIAAYEEAERGDAESQSA